MCDESDVWRVLKCVCLCVVMCVMCCMRKWWIGRVGFYGNKILCKVVELVLEKFEVGVLGVSVCSIVDEVCVERSWE